MKNVFFLLGSNLGNRELFLKQATESISKQIAAIVKSSAVYETQSWGKSDEPDYLNQVVEVQTDWEAEAVLNQILNIEKELGRERHEKWGSRKIDIDILFYGNDVINTENLTIPHPQLHKRRFTLEPLAEIAPQLMHPVLGKDIITLKNNLDDNLNVKKLYF